ncbi:MAG: signal recognition particle subunit SRP19/SEC65 family protein [Methanomassiliicoccales archaeon]|nr:signal recognition particle subunit SRP19/SEC65 family protein [Methanomassiliicoccales archaeon]
MALDEDKAWVLWPEYFDVRRSRDQGRKVKKNLAISEPNVEVISKALEKLGIEHKIESEKSYPSNWHGHKGRVLAEKTMKKSELLAKIGQEISKGHRS